MALGHRIPFTVAVGRWGASGQIGRAVAQLRIWIDRTQQRRALRELALHELNERWLRDIGVTREQALRESGRPFWDY
ncbi:MAG: hypothetical protein JO021_25870 [Alphaproteobacteria bacterium]|nr:hypothetical protein [Alphaproteobacteria bacterium]